MATASATPRARPAQESNANAAAADHAAIRNGRISGFWIGAVLKSGTVERVSVTDVENGLYVGFGAVVSNTASEPDWPRAVLEHE